MPAVSADPLVSDQSTAANLRRLLWLRAMAISAQISVMVAAAYFLDVQLPVVSLAGVMSALAALTLHAGWRLWRGAAISEQALFAQMLGDVAALTALLYFTGGATNPFVVLMLLPLTLAAAALPGRYSWLMAFITVACYTLLMFSYQPLVGGEQGHDNDFGLHVFGMWTGFVLSVGVVAYFVVRMNTTLRERERLLAVAREQALRDEKLVALGTLAAGAAHELGTPLSSLAVLCKDLEADYATDNELANTLRLMRRQVTRCKETLATLTAGAGAPRATEGYLQPVDDFLVETLTRWQEMRPGVVCRTYWEGAHPAPHLVAEQTLRLALINVLNNAADVSPQQVEVRGHWAPLQLTVDVCDQGPGWQPEAARAADKLVYSSKGPGRGLGLGLYLTHAVIERLGGHVEMLDLEGGGACTRIVLPLRPAGEDVR